MLSLESDLQDAVLDIDTPEWAGPEVRDDDTDEAEVLAKRAIYLKNIPIPQGIAGGAPPGPVELRGVRVDFLMARRKVREGRRMGSSRTANRSGSPIRESNAVSLA
ncbi:hypothetical protein E4U52_004608 [Claviceps spartinae]|nr:hypothetical protein E4U52_004608 [Claviceps spartinae]